MAQKFSQYPSFGGAERNYGAGGTGMTSEGGMRPDSALASTMGNAAPAPRPGIPQPAMNPQDPKRKRPTTTLPQPGAPLTPATPPPPGVATQAPSPSVAVPAAPPPVAQFMPPTLTGTMMAENVEGMGGAPGPGFPQQPANLPANSPMNPANWPPEFVPTRTEPYPGANADPNAGTYQPPMPELPPGRGGTMVMPGRRQIGDGGPGDPGGPNIGTTPGMPRGAIPGAMAPDLANRPTFDKAPAPLPVGSEAAEMAEIAAENERRANEGTYLDPNIDPTDYGQQNAPWLDRIIRETGNTGSTGSNLPGIGTPARRGGPGSPEWAGNPYERKDDGTVGTIEEFGRPPQPPVAPPPGPMINPPANPPIPETGGGPPQPPINPPIAPPPPEQPFLPPEVPEGSTSIWDTGNVIEEMLGTPSRYDQDVVKSTIDDQMVDIERSINEDAARRGLEFTTAPVDLAAREKARVTTRVLNDQARTYAEDQRASIGQAQGFAQQGFANDMATRGQDVNEMLALNAMGDTSFTQGLNAYYASLAGNDNLMRMGEYGGAPLDLLAGMGSGYANSLGAQAAMESGMGGDLASMIPGLMSSDPVYDDFSGGKAAGPSMNEWGADMAGIPQMPPGGVPDIDLRYRSPGASYGPGAGRYGADMAGVPSSGWEDPYAMEMMMRMGGRGG